jgi:hypothetical protein
MATYFKPPKFLFLLIAYGQALVKPYPKEVPYKFSITHKVSQLIIDFNVVVMVLKCAPSSLT